MAGGEGMVGLAALGVDVVVGTEMIDTAWRGEAVVGAVAGGSLIVGEKLEIGIEVKAIAEVLIGHVTGVIAGAGAGAGAGATAVVVVGVEAGPAAIALGAAVAAAAAAAAVVVVAALKDMRGGHHAKQSLIRWNLICQVLCFLLSQACFLGLQVDKALDFQGQNSLVRHRQLET